MYLANDMVAVPRMEMFEYVTHVDKVKGLVFEGPFLRNVGYHRWRCGCVEIGRHYFVLRTQ